MDSFNQQIIKPQHPGIDVNLLVIQRGSQADLVDLHKKLNSKFLPVIQTESKANPVDLNKDQPQSADVPVNQQIIDPQSRGVHVDVSAIHPRGGANFVHRIGNQNYKDPYLRFEDLKCNCQFLCQVLALFNQ